MQTNRRLRLLSLFVIGYMLLAFTWWSVLLFTKNKDAFTAKVELLRIGMVAEDIYTNEASFQNSERYQQLAKDYRKQEWMILGEACVFVLTLLTGLYLINRSYHKEMTAAQQRRNFLLSITHELKSPIAAIRLVLQTIERHQLKPEQKAQLLQNGQSENDRLNRLVNDLLLSARLEATYQPVFESLDFSELLQNAGRQLCQRHPAVQLETRIANNITLHGEASGLASMVDNLLENAVKYSEKSPRICLKAQVQKSLVVLEVSDQGIGIPDPEKNKVFDKFYRVGNEDTRKTKGTGLGLYIVREIVRAHKGKIEVRNNSPQGTVFRIELPLS